MNLKGKYPRLIAKTANFTIDPTVTKVGTLFTNRGATGNITATLPQLSGAAQQGGTWDGYWVEFQVEAGFNVIVACAAGKAITFNNAAATSLALQTAGQLIGGAIRAIWDTSAGKWVLRGVTVGHTFTVA